MKTLLYAPLLLAQALFRLFPFKAAAYKPGTEQERKLSLALRNESRLALYYVKRGIYGRK